MHDVQCNVNPALVDAINSITHILKDRGLCSIKFLNNYLQFPNEPTIVDDELKFQKVYAGWVPYLLSQEQREEDLLLCTSSWRKDMILWTTRNSKWNMSSSFLSWNEMTKDDLQTTCEHGEKAKIAQQEYLQFWEMLMVSCSLIVCLLGSQ